MDKNTPQGFAESNEIDDNNWGTEPETIRKEQEHKALETKKDNFSKYRDSVVKKSKIPDEYKSRTTGDGWHIWPQDARKRLDSKFDYYLRGKRGEKSLRKLFMSPSFWKEYKDNPEIMSDVLKNHYYIQGDNIDLSQYGFTGDYDKDYNDYQNRLKEHNNNPEIARLDKINGILDKEDKEIDSRVDNLFGMNSKTNPNKRRQLEIIQRTNPAQDNYHTWARTEDDIKTYDEALEDPEIGFTPDYTEADARRALKSGKVTVYSSKPIQNGAFVTPSRMEAENYAGSKNVYFAYVDLSNVAWIDALQGQIAK